jgi:hypothetical protein
MDELKGKVVVVTGASTPRGIGNATRSDSPSGRIGISRRRGNPKSSSQRQCASAALCRMQDRIESALIDLGEPGGPSA